MNGVITHVEYELPSKDVQEAIDQTEDRPPSPVVIPSVDSSSVGVSNLHPEDDGESIPRSSDEVQAFGHGMSKYFCFKQGYINLNHGQPSSVCFLICEHSLKIVMLFHRLLRLSSSPCLQSRARPPATRRRVS